MDWKALASGETIDLDRQRELQARWDGRAGTRFTKSIRMFDFESNGKPFTQVATVLTPEVAFVHEGRRVVVIASEGGHDDGREFLRDYHGREGIGPWLARRGVTFISLTRLGRWNFFDGSGGGSWSGVPLGERMPVFHRAQAAHWGTESWQVASAEGVSSPTGSTTTRVAREGSALHEHMMALTPDTSLRGFEHAIAQCLDLSRRSEMLTLYWGFSTGGPFLYALARRLAPDGYAGWGTANFGLAYFANRAATGDYQWLYDRSAFRVRERGYSDFTFYTRDLSDEQRAAQWSVALESPRFKSHEDTFMFFNVAAQTEMLTRLWHAPFLPADVRARGLAALLRENIELNYPDESLGSVAALDLFGSGDEILPPPVSSGAAALVAPYFREHRHALLQGRHHCIDADHAAAFGSCWLDAVTSGYFDR